LKFISSLLQNPTIENEKIVFFFFFLPFFFILFAPQNNSFRAFWGKGLCPLGINSKIMG
jgi:hypothetical protein